MSLRWPFLCLQKNRTSPNFSQPELARVPNFSYLRESSQDIPRIMFKSYTSNDNLLLPPYLGDFIPQNDPVRVRLGLRHQTGTAGFRSGHISGYHPEESGKGTRADR